MSKFLTKQEVADIIRVTPLTVMKMVKRGDLPKPLRLGNTLRWPVEAIQTALAVRDV